MINKYISGCINDICQMINPVKTDPNGQLHSSRPIEKWQLFFRSSFISFHNNLFQYYTQGFLFVRSFSFVCHACATPPWVGNGVDSRALLEENYFKKAKLISQHSFSICLINIFHFFFRFMGFGPFVLDFNFFLCLCIFLKLFFTI